MNWYRIAKLQTKNYNKSIQEHVKGVLEANLSCPIFVTEDHYIIDGMHRALKAIVKNKPIEAIVLTQDQMNEAVLQPNENYSGQVYMTDLSGQAEKYAVNKIIELYQSNPSTSLDPQQLLRQNIDGWSNVNPLEVLEGVLKVLKETN